MSKDYRLQIKVKNNVLLELMEARGIESQSELARRTGLDPATVGKFTNLQIGIYAKGSKDLYNKSAMILAEYFHVLPENLMPSDHVALPLENNTAEVKVSMEEIEQIAYDGDRKMEFISDLTKMVIDLPRRERRTISMYHGLYGNGEHTFNEIGKEGGAKGEEVTGQMMRQVYFRGLRRLKKRDRAGALSEYLKETG